MKPFFIDIPNFWAWADKLGRQIGQINFGVFEVFWAKLSAPFLVLCYNSTIISTKD
jgi:hypothetical protein